MGCDSRCIVEKDISEEALKARETGAGDEFPVDGLIVFVECSYSFIRTVAEEWLFSCTFGVGCSSSESESHPALLTGCSHPWPRLASFVCDLSERVCLLRLTDPDRSRIREYHFPEAALEYDESGRLRER